MKKLKAFTLMELLVVMILSAIAISMATITLEMIRGNFINISYQSEIMLDQSHFTALLTFDADRAERIIENPEGIRFLANDFDIQYHFGTEVIREMGSPVFMQDTIYRFPTDYAVEAHGQETDALINKVTVRFSEGHPFTITKTYSAEAFINKSSWD